MIGLMPPERMFERLRGLHREVGCVEREEPSLQELRSLYPFIGGTA
jgi:hypothetical protein